MLRMLFLLGCLAAPHPVSAQRVELLSFGESESPPVGPDILPAASHTTSEKVVRLTANLAGFGVAADGIEPSLSVTRRVIVPSWMKVGRPPRQQLIGTRADRGQSTQPGVERPCGHTVYRPRPDLPASVERRRSALYPLISRIACDAGVPAGLLDALVGQESRYRVGALSPKGAMGLAQLMPGTARQLRVTDPWHPVENLRGGAKYLRLQLEEFGRVDLALAAYNAGPGHVRRRGAIPPFRETLNYVLQIMRAWQRPLVPIATERAHGFRSPEGAKRKVQLVSYIALPPTQPLQSAHSEPY